MARKPRIHYPGAVYHVMLRGNAKQAIFHKDEEYRYFENILAQGLEQNSVRLHAYCWMENHVHMALQVKDKLLSKLMRTRLTKNRLMHEKMRHIKNQITTIRKA